MRNITLIIAMEHCLVQATLQLTNAQPDEALRRLDGAREYGRLLGENGGDRVQGRKEACLIFARGIEAAALDLPLRSVPTLKVLKGGLS